MDGCFIRWLPQVCARGCKINCPLLLGEACINLSCSASLLQSQGIKRAHVVISEAAVIWCALMEFCGAECCGVLPCVLSELVVDEIAESLLEFDGISAGLSEGLHSCSSSCMGIWLVDGLVRHGVVQCCWLTSCFVCWMILSNKPCALCHDWHELMIAYYQPLLNQNRMQSSSIRGIEARCCQLIMFLSRLTDACRYCADIMC